MSNSWFQFKQFTIHQDKCAMKVTTDGCLFGAWVAKQVGSKTLEVRNALDIGTGTGLLSLMLAQKNDCHIDAIEMEQEAFEQASENAATSPWKERVNVMQGDVNTFEFKQAYDLIICNPPFYEKELKGDDLKKNTAHHDAGLQLNSLLTLIRKNLAKGGHFFLLLPFKRHEELKKLLTENLLQLSRVCFVRQTVSHDFFRVLVSGKISEDHTKPATTTTAEIAINAVNNQYTPEFISLLHEYYLHL
ncbi:MAG: methyltransferase [Chitinophagaceae bacterium]